MVSHGLPITYQVALAPDDRDECDISVALVRSAVLSLRSAFHDHGHIQL